MKCNRCANRKCRGDHRQRCKGYQAPQSGFKIADVTSIRVMNWPTTQKTIDTILGKGVPHAV